MKKNIIGEQLVFEIENHEDAEFLTVTCSARRMREDDEQMAPQLKVSSYELQYHDDLKPFYRFTIEGQASVRNTELYGRRHGFIYETRDVIDEGAAARMAKTLRSINAKLTNFQIDEGRPLSFGQYCARVARAIGAREFIEAGQDGNQARYTLGAAMARIDQIGREWKQRHSSEKPA